MPVRRFLALLICLPLIAACSSTNSSGTGSETSFVAGDGTMVLIDSNDREQIVNLVGTTLDGDALDIASYQGQVVVVNVWASW